MKIILALILLTAPVLAADLPRVGSIVGGVRNMTEIMTYDLSRYPHGLPCKGLVSSAYGYRKDPLSKLPKDRRPIRFHAGLDICNVKGTPIKAVAAGTVIFAGWQQGYGYCVEIRHTKALTTLYGHLCTIGVYVGEEVYRGQPIGCMGSTGTRSTGDHTHFETRLHGVPVDPGEWR
jgi:murein DD-endopeptidase MepM/ murein hydrolase activator NlpD